MIKGVIFDLGGVLIDNPALPMKSHITRVLKISEAQLHTLTTPLIPLYQKGLLTEEEFWRRVTKNIKLEREITTSIWEEAIKKSYSPKTEMFSLVSELKKNGMKIGILSNTEIPVVNFLSRMDYSIFDVLIYSCLEGMRKPEKEIYLLSINRMGFKGEEIIFIDDSEENIKASQESGMHSILFVSPTQIRDEIGKLTGIV